MRARDSPVKTMSYPVIKTMSYPVTSRETVLQFPIKAADVPLFSLGRP